MSEQFIKKQMTIKEAVEAVEKLRGSTVISYISDARAIFDVDDCLMLDNNLSQLTNGGQNKIEKLDLVLQSPGGILEAAYKFLRICKEYSNEFNVIVPFSAKSAATVICLGAKEIVMTSISELGPVDPIIQNPKDPNVRIPARAIKEYMDLISSPDRANINIDKEIRDTLNKGLDPYLIGSYEMALKNSKEIIEKILKENESAGLSDDGIVKIIDELTEKHASHSYPIDRRELEEELGFKNIVKAEGDLLVAIKQLFGIYTQYMRQNNFIKLQGNREQNQHIQIIPQVVKGQDQVTPPVNFS